MKLSVEEIAFFKENGYLIKRRILDPELMAQARESLWAAAPPDLDRNDPDSWVGAFADDRWTWKYRDRGEEAWMIRLLATDPQVRAMAAQLLGPDLEVPQRVRGVYCIFPEGDVPERPTVLHVDRHPFHLGTVGLVDHVPPGGGGFTVWPGSHRVFYPLFETRYTFNPGPGLQEAYPQVMQGEPVECHGEAGDIVFWHHRLGHSAGHNRSRQIRQAVLYDFKKMDLEEKQDLPPATDMWADWAV